MALDGITTASIIHELKTLLLGGRVDKIHQPLQDEISFQVRGVKQADDKKQNPKILLSANPNNPRIHITQTTKENPMKAPLFCMVLRKHIAGGKITDIYQPDFERIIIIKVESANEMGDRTEKHLILEIMGKHSNIILTDENMKILDSIKRISHEKSSVREVLPNKQYVFPPSQNKKNPLEESKQPFLSNIHLQEGRKIQEFIFQSYVGISPIMASEICHRANLQASMTCAEMTDSFSEALFQAFSSTIAEIKNQNFSYHIYYNQNDMLDFAVLEMQQFQAYQKKSFHTISELLEGFYAERDHIYHIKQKSSDMRRIIQINLERCIRKKELQLKTRKDTKNMDKWKKKGELITANIYSISQGMTILSTTDFYEEDMPTIEIALDPTKSPSENAQAYFSKYNKAKRTLTALEEQEKQNNDELTYLESVLNALDVAKDIADLTEIRSELAQSGFMKKQVHKKGRVKIQKAKPLHYISSDGFHIYVGKSNLQNDELTLKFAHHTDIWLHTKEIAGSHVIIATNGTGEVPDTTLDEAGHLAAYFSKGKYGSMVAIDYTLRKNVKKPSGAKAGMVIYLTNRTIYITPDENKIQKLKVVES